MFDGFFRKLFGSANERRIKNYRPRVEAINALEKELEGLSDDALRARTESSRRKSPKASRSRTFWFRPSRPAARLPSAPSASAISMCS